MNNLTEPFALSLVRRLSGTEHYPFHLEGETRLAEILIQNTEGMGHARAVVDEFDGETCPSVESLRSMCLRFGEKCKCGRALWQHRDLPDCKRFSAVDPDELPKPRADARAAEAVRGLRDSVPLIPGVRWDVCLQMECIRLAGSTARSEFMPIYERDYPEALADARRGAAIDPYYVEQRMRALKPHLFFVAADKNLKVLRGLSSVGPAASNRDVLG